MFEYMNMGMTMFHGLGMFIFWIVIVFLIISLVSRKDEKQEDTPLDILKKRLVKGEISKEEYEELKKFI